MKTSNKNISPETIDFYMQKGRQERSDAIFNGFKWMTQLIKYLATIFIITKSFNSNNKSNSSDNSKGKVCKTA